MPNIDETAKAWQMAVTARVGSTVQRRRKKLGLTAQQLAQRTVEAGYPITRVAISKIETNSRAGKMDLAEILVLSAVLEIPPVYLLFPGRSSTSEVLPSVTLTDVEARYWADGTKPLPGHRRNPGVWLSAHLSTVLGMIGHMSELRDTAHKEGLSADMRGHLLREAREVEEAIGHLDDEADRLFNELVGDE